MFVTLAEWAATRVTALGVENVRAWKPNLLVPLEHPARIERKLPLLTYRLGPARAVQQAGQSIAQTLGAIS